MSRQANFMNHDGRLGTIDVPPDVPEGRDAQADVRLATGETLTIPMRDLEQDSEGIYSLRAKKVIPVIEEVVEVKKRTVQTGALKLEKQIHEREEIVDVPIRRDTIEVVRVPLNRIVDGFIDVRQEGASSIYSVVEEVAIVTKQYILREEIRVTRRTLEEHESQNVLLRSEEIVVTRSASNQV